MAKKEYDNATQTLIATERRDLLDTKSGEIITVEQITKTVYGTKNFWKCYLIDFLSVLGVIDSKQIDVFIYIAENTNPSTNLFIGTYRKISADVNVCTATVAKIMTKLQKNNFVRKVQSGLWFVNPNILMKGNDNKRQILLSYYEADTPVNELTYKRTRREEIKQDDTIPGQMIITTQGEITQNDTE